MDFQGKAVLVFLQEDNISRAYFRVHPLLCDTGSVSAEAISDFPDEGFLRIVPDKNEQHTFKERMRSLCGLCLMDLRHLPPEVNKIRTNKNYSPSRGEVNQFIVYSDAIRALPDHLLYQVVAEEQIVSAFTPQVYIRRGANIQGPFQKDTAQPVGDTVPLAPDSKQLFTVTVEDQEYLFYWPCTEAVPAPEKQPAAAPTAPAAPEVPASNAFNRIQEMNSELSDNANRLREENPTPVDFVPEQPQRPLVGTKLYQSPFQRVVPHRAHNPLMEAVEQQRYAAKYEAPGAVLPQNAELKDVQNPVDVFKRALQNVCQTPEAQKHAVDTLLAQSGMRSILSKALVSGKNDVTLSAMHTQLQELEAERLMTLMQLDDVKKNLASAREEIVGKLHQDEQKKLDALHAAHEAEKKAADDLRATMKGILAERSEAAALIEQAAALQGKLVLCPALGKDCDQEELTRRTAAVFTAAGFRMDADDARALLILFAQAENRLQINADTRSDAREAARVLAHALGAACGEYHETKAGEETVRVLPGGNAAAIVIDDEDALPPASNVLHISLRQNREAAQKFPDEYGVLPYAAFTCETNAEALPAALPSCGAVRLSALKEEMLRGSALNRETLDAITALRNALKAAGCSLPLSVSAKVAEFVSAAQNILSGGVAEALDRAVCSWIVPHIHAYQLDIEALLPIVAAMPRTVKALKA